MSRLDRESIAWMRSHHQAISNTQLVGNGVSLGQRKRMVAGWCFGRGECSDRVAASSRIAGGA